jgi:energy-coupling factor transporter ATP-binding protein EcfA2
MKWFEVQRVKEACEHLGDFNSAWVIVPLVLASNGVNSRTLVNVDDGGRPGTTRFLERFFSGQPIGLPAFDNGHNFLRPKFADLKNSSASPSDLAVHQKANLWGSTYSSRGYREMRNRGELAGEGSEFKLNRAFLPKWQAELPATFHFEELLVWLYAFSGFPDAVKSWKDLYDDYQQRVLNGVTFDTAFQTRFHVGNHVPWPATLLSQRPADQDFIATLLPSRATVQLQANMGVSNALLQAFETDLSESGVEFESERVRRVVAGLMAKRFTILTGLSGSGKTKLAQAFARWITSDYALIPVGADWTGNENIVGYADGLDGSKYVSRPALDLIRHAIANPTIPHFLVLDEMNLSHVERYFADLLSAVESGETIPLYSGTPRSDSAGQQVPDRLVLPGNLFIIGTVNVDETTYMFSPKVLDRANVIEFRMDAGELAAFLANPQKPDLTQLDGKGTSFGAAFVAAANDAAAGVPTAVKAQYETQMKLFFDLLRGHGAEYGYRVAHEAARFMHFYHKLGGFADADTAWFDTGMDAVIVQKFLPKLHGSRAKLGPLLKKLWQASILPTGNRDPQAEMKEIEDKAAPNSKDAEPSAVVPPNARYPISAEKIARMWRLLADNGFASFAEA